MAACSEAGRSDQQGSRCNRPQQRGWWRWSRCPPRTAGAPTRPRRNSCRPHTRGSPSLQSRSDKFPLGIWRTPDGDSWRQRCPVRTLSAKLRLLDRKNRSRTRSSREGRRRRSRCCTCLARTLRAARASRRRGTTCQERRWRTPLSLARSGRIPPHTAGTRSCRCSVQRCRAGKPLVPWSQPHSWSPRDMVCSHSRRLGWWRSSIDPPGRAAALPRPLRSGGRTRTRGSQSPQ